MTEQEAIKLIDDRMCFGRGKWSEHHMPEIDDYWEAGQMAIKALEQPERKKGKWIMKYKGSAVTSYKCSECGRTVKDDTGYDVSKDYPFCYCGAKMEGEE